MTYTPTVKIVSFNILAQWNTNMMDRISKISEHLLVLGADIIVLQEVLHVSFVKIAEQIGHKYSSVFKTIYENNTSARPDGEAIFYAKNILSVTEKKFINLPSKEGRTMSIVGFKIDKYDTEFTVSTAHFETDYAIRQKQLAKATECLNAYNKIIFAGDTNIAYDESEKENYTKTEVFENMYDAWLTCSTTIGSPYTYHGDRFSDCSRTAHIKMRYDRMFYRNATPVKCVTYLAPELSDHDAILSVFEV